MIDRFWYDGQAHNGRQISLDITDPGLLYGATVFSTLRVYQADLDHAHTGWSEHCDRLRQSIHTFGWTAPDWQRLHHGATWLAAEYPVLRLTLFADGREWITGRSLPPDLLERQTQGITAWMATGLGQRSLPHHKTGNYLTPWLGLQQLAQVGSPAAHAQEAILTNAAGHWLETLTGNLWGWADDRWYTPSLAVGILPGIQRDRLIRKLQCHNRTVVETTWDEALTARLESLAYTNCVVEVIPIRAILTGTVGAIGPDPQHTYDPNHQALAELRQMLSCQCS